jgi:hypothetical protein
LVKAHFLAQHDYDDVAARVWSVYDVTVSLDRTGIITYSWFDTSPAQFCFEGRDQTFSDFLESGLPDGVTLKAGTEDEMRAHLLGARRAGSSTFLTLDGNVSDVWSWTVDGVVVRAVESDGPAGAGYGWFPRVPGRSLLVRSGAHRVEVNVKGAMVVRDVTIQRAEHVAIAI